MHGRSGLLPPTSGAGVSRHDPGLGADPPHAPLRHRVAGVGELVGDEPVPEPGVVGVDLIGGVHRVRVDEVTFADRASLPGVERLR